MRKKPVLDKTKEDFIKGAYTERIDAIPPEKKEVNNRHLKWPMDGSLLIHPSMENGGSLRRPINIPLREFEWNTIDKHTKSLGVGKSEWIRHAIYLLLDAEQKYYFDE